jgi:hypothetical protein
MGPGGGVFTHAVQQQPMYQPVPPQDPYGQSYYAMDKSVVQSVAAPVELNSVADPRPVQEMPAHSVNYYETNSSSQVPARRSTELAWPEVPFANSGKGSSLTGTTPVDQNASLYQQSAATPTGTESTVYHQPQPSNLATPALSQGSPTHMQSPTIGGGSSISGMQSPPPGQSGGYNDEMTGLAQRQAQLEERRQRLMELERIEAEDQQIRQRMSQIESQRRVSQQ